MTRFSLITFALLLPLVVEATDTIEVIAYRATTDTPVTYENLDRAELDRENPTVEPSYFLSHTPSITQYSDSGSYQGYSYIRMRGMDQTRINMTLDGVPLNEPEDQGVYFSNYPGIVGALENIQIQRGVGISQNGTASFAGSIQLTSVDLDRPQQAQVSLGAGSFDTRHGTAQVLSGIDDDKRFFLQGSTVQTDGYKYHSGNDSHSLFASTQFKDDYGYWKISGFHGEQSNELAWLGVNEAQIKADPRSNANSDEGDHFEQSLIYLIREQQLSSTLKASTTLYYNKLIGNYDFDLDNFLGQPPSGAMLNYAFDSDFCGLIAVASYEADTLSVSGGLHVSDYQRTHTGKQTEGNMRLFRNTGHKDSTSTFLKTLYQVGNFTAFTDIQYRATDFRYRGSVDMPEQTWSFLNTTAGVTYRLDSATSVYYSIGKTGREPARTDLFGGNENLEANSSGEPLLYIVKPEYVLDQELGLRHDAMGVQYKVNFFYMDFTHEITLNGQFGANGLPLNQDVQSSVRKGVELSSAVPINNKLIWTTAASMSRNEIHAQHENLQQTLSPEQILTTSLDYNSNHVGYGLRYRYQGSSYLDIVNTQALPAYRVLDSYVTYTIDKTELRLLVNNILDEQYVTSGAIDFNGQPTYFVAPPRNVYFSIKVNL